MREADLAEALRGISHAPRSEAVLQMAVVALGKIGTPDDQAWLVSRIPMASPALYRTTEAAWWGLKSAGVNK